MDFDFNSAIQYFNIGILVTLASGALLGFLKGTFKSAYNFLVFGFLLAAGWLLSPVIVKYVMGFDISKYYELTIRSVEITSIENSFPALIDIFIPKLAGLVVPGSASYDAVSALIFMVLRIAVMILWLILMATVFKFIFWIIYQIIRPKTIGRKNRIGIFSRFGGLLIGLLHSLLIVFLFSIPLSGLTSIGNSLVEMLPEEADQYAQVADGKTRNLQVTVPELEAFQEVFDFMASYRNSLSGEIASIVEIDGVPADEYLFDELFSIKLENDVNLQLKSELETLLRAYAILVENVEGEITAEKVAALDDEVIEEIFAEIGKLNLLRVAASITAEYSRLNGWLDFLTEEEYEEFYTELVNIDYGSDLKYLTKALIKAYVLGLFNGDGSIEFYLSLDGDQVEAIFAELGKLKSVDLLADILVDYLVYREYFNKLGIETESLNFENVSWSSEIENIGTFFKAILALGITVEDGKVSIHTITDDGINRFSTAVFNSRLFTNNNLLLAQALINLLPDDYRSVFEISAFEKEDLISLLSLAKVLDDAGLLGDDFEFDILLEEENADRIAEAISNSQLISSNVGKLLKLLLEKMNLPFPLADESFERDWSKEAGKTEIKALFAAARELYDLGLAGDDFFNNLSSDEVESLADKISASDVLMSNMGNMIDYLFGEGKTIGNISIDTSSVQNMDWTSAEGHAEFRNIMKAVSTLFEAGLHENPDFTKLGDGSEDTNADGVIDEKDNLIGRLAKSFSSSVLIRNNLSNLLSSITSEQIGDIEIVTFDNPDDWTKQEIESLLLAVKIFANKENLPEDLFNLSESELDIVLGSQLISRSLVQNLKDLTAQDGQLHGFLITDNIQDSNWYDRYENGERVFDGELRKLFVSGKILLGDNPNFDDSENLISLNRVLEIKDEEIDKIVQSTVLKNSFANKLIEMNAGEDSPLEVNLDRNDPAWTDEIKHLIQATKILLGEEADLDNLTFNINKVKSLTDADIDTVLSSVIVSDTIIRELVKIGENPDGGLVVRFEKTDPAWRGSDTAPGELKNFLTAVIRILDDDDDLNSSGVIDVNRITKLTEEEIDILSNSYLIVDTAVKHLRDMTAPGGSLHSVVYLPTLADDEYYGSDGEFKRFMISIELVLQGNGSGEKLEDLDKISLSSLTGENQVKVLASEIVKETIIRNIEIEAGKPGSVIKIAPELDRTDSLYQKEAWDAELPKLLDAIIAIIGQDSYLNDLGINENDFLALGDSEIALIVESRLISFTAVKTIEANAKKEDSLIALPFNLDPENPAYDEALWYGENGELAKTLKALRELGFVAFNNDICLQAVFAEARGDAEEVILASKVLEASLINKIEKEATTTLSGILIIPEGIVWEKTESDQGELRRFLQAIEIIIGEEDLQAATFEVDKFLGSGQDTLLASKIVEASAISYIQKSDKLTIPSQTETYYYFEDETLVWEGENGELRKFLKGIKTLLGTSTFADFVFTMDNLLEVDFEEALKSRVLEATLADMVMELLSEDGALHGMIKEPEYGYQWYHHQSSTDPDVGAIRRGEFELNGNLQYSDLSGFLKAIQALTEAGLNYNNINKDTIVACDTELLSSALCDYSRIIGTSIATLLNYALKDIEHPLKPVFNDEDLNYQDKVLVKNALDSFSYFVKFII